MGDQPSGIWAELRRRRVVSTTAAYAAVSFVLLQLAEILFPAFALGPGALRILFALLIAGFPIAVALSWVYDVTRGGVRRTDEGEAGPPRVLVGGIALGAVALAWGLWGAVTSVGPLGVNDASIAVLPFADRSAERDQGYLGDGLAEEILNLLAQVDGLQVAARTSSFAFRENDDIRDIGSQLGVATILEGSIRRDSLRVHVTADLIDAQTGFKLWSETYDRELEDFFAVEDEIAQAIAVALFGELDVGVVTTAERYEPLPEARDLYWQGQAQWDRRDARGIPAAIDLFRHAIEIDSMYAQAYAGLAASFALLPQFSASQSEDEALSTAEELARRAIALDDDLPEPHASLGLVRAFRGDRIGALISFTNATERGPSYAPAYHWRANVEAEMGRLGEALEDAQQAAEFDPLSPAIASDYGNLLLWAGHYEAAAGEFERAQELEFGFGAAVFGSALVALATGEEVGLRMALSQWAALERIPIALAEELGAGMLEFEKTGSPQPVPPVLAGMFDSGMLSAGLVASLHALLGQVDGTIEWLQKAIEDRSWVDLYLRVNPIFDVVRAEDGFTDVIRQLDA